MSDVAIDIAIIGAGIAGFYAAYQLIEQYGYNAKNIQIFERSERIGGRIETIKLNNFLAEAGSMRIEPQIQKTLDKLLAELKLKTVDTFENYGLSFVPKQVEKYQLREDEKNKNALELIYLAVAKILRVPVADLISLEEKDFDWIASKAKFNGQYLWQLGWWQLLAEVLSYEAIKFIIHTGCFYHFVHENLNAGNEVIFFIRVLKTNRHLKNVSGGMFEIIKALYERVINAGTQLHKKHELTSLRANRQYVELKFNNNKIINAKRVILAVPQGCLVKLDQYFSKEIKQCLHAVKALGLMKCFFVINKPWWPANIESNVEAHLLPTRELHYYHSKDGKGMILLYCDRPYNRFWRSYFPTNFQEETRINQDEGLAQAFVKCMPCRRENVLDFAVRDWQLPPYHGGIYFWRTGVQMREVMQELLAFSLPGSTEKNIHIVGDSFSNYQGYIEGALRITKQVLEMISLRA